MSEPMIAIIVALHEATGIIGDRGKLPWRSKEDMVHFRQTTMGCPVIMGRKTWESLPKEGLPGRKIIVMSRSLDSVASGMILAHSIKEAIYHGKHHARKMGSEKIFVAGGSEIFSAFIPHVEMMYLTFIWGNGSFTGDTYFKENWRDFGEVVEERTLSPVAQFVKIKRKKN